MLQREDIRTYREELKGFAILWVVFFHALLGLDGWLLTFQSLGYSGVDIFFFLTGFGLYYSLNRSQNIGAYIHRRLWRLLPAYLPLCLMWLVMMVPEYNLSTIQTVRTVMGNLLMIGYMTNVPHVISWYVTGLTVVILLAPIIYGCLQHGKRPVITWLALVALSFAVGFCFITDDRLIAISRLPIFVIGMGFAMTPKKELNRYVKIAIYLLMLVVGLTLKHLSSTRYTALLIDYGMHWYPFAFITPPLCVTLAWCLRKLKRWSSLFAPLRYVGKASFEIFLFNTWFERYCKNILALDVSIAYLWWGLASIAAGCLYHALVELCVKKLRKCKPIVA